MTDLTQPLRHHTRTGNHSALNTLLTDHPELPFVDEPELAAAHAAALAALAEHDSLLLRLAAAPSPADPTLSADALADWGLASIGAGELPRAESYLQAALARDPRCAAAWSRLAICLLLTNRLEEAHAAFDQALLLAPDHPELLANAAALDLRLGRLREAEARYARALALKPELELAFARRMALLAEQGRIDELLAELTNQIATDPDNLKLIERLAALYTHQGRHQEAAATLVAALDRQPQAHELRPLLLAAWLAADQPGLAGTTAKSWLDDETLAMPETVARQVRLLLNEARIKNQFFEAAIDDLTALRATDPDADGAVRTLLAKALADSERGEEAVPLLREVTTELPGKIDAALLLVHTLTALGQLAEANAELDRLAALGLAEALLPQRIEANDYRATPEEREALNQRFATPGLPDSQKAALGFTLYRVLDKAGDYPAAFTVLREANDAVKRHIPYDWRHHRRFVEETLATFTPELIAALSGRGHPSADPIFVVGMPRSGTTLTEQILAAHPACAGRGELQWIPRLTRLMPEVWHDPRHYPLVLHALLETTEQPLEIQGRRERGLLAAAFYYLQRAGKGVAAGLRTVDKMPHNFDYVGLIALLFPRAPIIHVVRDPLDNALSNYEQNFAAAHGLMGFAFDLSWIGEMLVDHDRIMAHWYELFPNRIFRLSYEALVSNPEPVLRQLLDFCRLPWTDAVLQFQKNRTQVRTASIRQVRQGIYQSSKAKWRRYEQELAPVQAILDRGFKTLSELGQTPPAALAPSGWWGVTF